MKNLYRAISNFILEREIDSEFQDGFSTGLITGMILLFVVEAIVILLYCA